MEIELFDSPVFKKIKKEYVAYFRKLYDAAEVVWKYTENKHESFRKSTKFKEAIEVAKNNGIDLQLFHQDNIADLGYSDLRQKVFQKLRLAGNKEAEQKLRVLYYERDFLPLEHFTDIFDTLYLTQHWEFTEKPSNNEFFPVWLQTANHVYDYKPKIKSGEDMEWTEEGDWLEENFFTNPRGMIRAVVYTEDREYEYNFQDIPAAKKLLNIILETSIKWGEAARATDFDFDVVSDGVQWNEDCLKAAWEAAPEELRTKHIKAVRQLVKIVWKYHQEELARKDGGKYRTIQQGPTTNGLAKTDFRVKPEQLSLCGDALIKSDGFKVIIEKFNELKRGVRPTAQYLLDALLIKATETSQNTQNTLVTLPLKSYMQMRGLSDGKSARAQIKEDLDALAKITVPLIPFVKGKVSDFYDFPICSGKGIVRGVITMRFSEDFFKLYRNYPPMAYHEDLLKLNIKYNPYAYGLGRRISEHKNMNIGKSNENIMSVATLLDAIPDMPRYEELGDAGQLRKRIIDPFERDLNILEKINMLTWHYCGKNGAEMSEPTTYKEFREGLVKFTWLDYPDQTERIEKIAERAAAKEEEKKTKPKKKRKTKAQSAS